jgi:deoxycytidine triphosphate deaminase
MNMPQWPKLEETVKAGEGFLVDREIGEALNHGRLITEGDRGQAKYACYEMRIGPDIRQLVLDQVPGGENDLYRVKRINDDHTFQINPGETFKIFALEKLWMPANVFAITIPVGNMYKLGLNPETTFADPGFNGPFFVTVCNYSPRIVKLKVGDPLARVFFFKLADRPDRIHEGDPREIPPSLERVPRPNFEDLKKRGEAALLDDVLRLVDPPHYQHAFVTQRIFAHHREETNSRILRLRQSSAVMTLVNLASFFIVLLIGVTFFGQFLRSWWPAIFENLLAEFVGAIVVGMIVVGVIPPLRRAFFDAIGALTNKDTDRNAV